MRRKRGQILIGGLVGNQTCHHSPGLGASSQPDMLMTKRGIDPGLPHLSDQWQTVSCGWPVPHPCLFPIEFE